MMSVKVQQIKSFLGPFKFYLAVLVVILILLFSGYWFGNQQAAQQRMVIDNLRQSVTRLNQDNEQLRRQLNISSVELEVEKLTNLDVQGDLKQFVNEANDLKKQLSFYQRVLAPELDADGFEVYSVETKALLSENYFEFVATLMQKQKTQRSVKGKLSFSIVGSLDGKPHTVFPFSQSALTPLAFSFRYFETVRQVFQLPEDFIPEQVEVTANITSSKRRLAKHNQVFPWAQ